MNTTISALFFSGGIFMWPLLVLSAAGVALIIECLIQMFFFNKSISQFQIFLKSSGAQGRLLPGFEQTDLFSQSADDFEKYIGQEVQLVYDRMFRRLEYLSAISAVAPLLGFIGTVSGMIASFQTIADANKVSVNLVAGGISEALITTGFGLIIAVICLASEHLFRFVLTASAHSVEELVTRIARNRNV